MRRVKGSSDELLHELPPVCSSHGLGYCRAPECIVERGGSVLAAELAQAELWAGGES